MNEENFVKATSDIFIKYLFGMDTEESNRLMLSFINSVLQDADFPAITRVIQKNPFNYKEFENNKLTVLDVEVEDERGKIYNIEVQSSGDYDFCNRALYYWSKLYTSQLENGDEYTRLLPVISINILSFKFLPELPAYHNFFMITEGRDREYVLTDHLVLHFLELPKIEDAKMSSKIARWLLYSKIARWLLYLKTEGRDNKMLKILLKDDDDLRLAHKKYETFTGDKKLRRLAISREKAERDRLYHINIARRKGLEEGLGKGREEGELEEKHNVLIRQLELKYALSEDEREHILFITDFEKLDAALDAVVLSEDKESVLKLL
jgi:predicted transposase/invertase (TIGR01784 family)